MISDEEALAHLTRRGISPAIIQMIRQLLPGGVSASAVLESVVGHASERRLQDDLTGNRPQLERAKQFLIEEYGTERPTKIRVRTSVMLNDAAEWFKAKSMPLPDKSIIFEASGRGGRRRLT